MSSTTLKAFAESVTEEYAVGRVGALTTTSSTSTIVDGTRFIGPFAGNEFPRGSPIRITSGARRGQTSYITDYAPATGTFTVSPVWVGAAFVVGDTFVIGKGDILDSYDRMVEAANRCMSRTLDRWMRVPLTFVPNGDYLAASATPVTGWAETSAAGVYVNLAHPDGYYQRVLQNTSSAGDGRLTSTTLKAAPNDTWNLYTFNRVTTAGDEAKLVIQDETNSAVITPTFQTGDPTYSGLSWQDILCTFTIPATCYTISIRLQSTASGDVSQWGPIVAAPQGAQAYTGQTGLEFLQDVGDLWTFTTGTYGPQERQWRRSGANLVYGSQFGWGQGLSLDRADFPLFADMLLPYPEFPDEFLYGSTTTAVGATTLTDTVATWTTNQFAGATLIAATSAPVTTTAVIVSNTATVLTFAAWSAGTPTSPTGYNVVATDMTTAAPKDLLTAGAAVEFFQWADDKERWKLAPGVQETRFSPKLRKAERDWITANAQWNAPKRISIKQRYAGTTAYA